MPGSRRWHGYVTRERYKRSATNDAWYLTHKSVAKENSDDSPYLVPNEWICSQLAQFLRLPVPPSALMRSGPTRKGMFASLEFGAKDSTPDDADIAACARQDAETCTGILLFDVLVANPDRHAKNLHVDDPAMPREITIFDHDRALFGIFAEEGIRRLTELRDRLGTSGGSQTGQNRNCLMDALTTTEHFAKWTARIRSVPPWLIANVCDEVVQCGITREEADAAVDFLAHRSQLLNDIVWEHREQLKGIKMWGLVRDF